MQCLLSGLLLAVWTASVNGQIIPKPIEFSVVSVRPSNPSAGWPEYHTFTDGLRFRNNPLSLLIEVAYGIPREERVLGLPGWSQTARFDVDAKVDDTDQDRWSKLTFAEKSGSLMAVLEERFKLRYRFEVRTFSGLGLVRVKGGPKAEALIEAKEMTEKGAWSYIGTNILEANNLTLGELAEQILSRELQQPVLDQTNISGRFTFRLSWSHDKTQGLTTADGTESDIYSSLSDQLGLRLVPIKIQGKVLIVESIDHPSMN